jgi:hypothetical protein
MFTTFNQRDNRKEELLYGGIALGVFAGAAIATYLWKRRTGEMGEASASPLVRAEQLIESCESKLESIERAISDLKSSR